MCRYLRVPGLIMDSVFGFFAFSWVITRDILFGIVIYSAYKRSPQLMEFKWDPENGHYITYTGYVAFVSLLLALQVCATTIFLSFNVLLIFILKILLFIWTIVLLRIIWNVLGGNPPDDSRSDEERHVETHRPTCFRLNVEFYAVMMATMMRLRKVNDCGLRFFQKNFLLFP